jgi:predicted TIM-barrel fold metal-dependent hydrolase
VDSRSTKWYGALVTATGTATAPARTAERQPVIDTDVHEMLASAEQLLPYLPRQWHRYIKSGWNYPFFFTYGYPTDAGFARVDAVPLIGPAGSDYDLMREQLLEEHAVEIAVLTSLFFPGDMRVQTEFGNALASAYNDWLTETWLARDGRFRGSVCVNASDPEAAAHEIDRVGERPQYAQVILGPMNAGYGEPRFDPIFAAAERRGLLVAIHGSARAETAIGYPELLSEWRVLGPTQHHQSQLVSLIFHGVFERHPTLRTVFVEGGWSWLPHVIWRMDENYRSLRVELPWLKRMPREYVLEHTRFTTQPMETLTAKQLTQLLEHIGSDEMLLFSSDYPHWDFDASSRVMPAGLPAELLRKIQYENAKAWYRF